MGGNNNSRILDIKNVQQHLTTLQVLENKECSIYGDVSHVWYKDMEFNLASSSKCEAPHPKSIHYLVRPNYLIFPQFTLLQEIPPSSLNELLLIIQGICEMAVESLQAGRHLGVGYNRIAYKDRWGVVGEEEDDWPFERILEYKKNHCQQEISGVFFSPQQMISLSNGRQRYDCEKSDVFALGIMLVEIIFNESLDMIYDYQRFEIRLNPLLQKLQRIKEQFGQEVAGLFVRMLQIEEDDRYDFQELLEAVSLIIDPPSRPGISMLNSNGSQRNIERSRGTRPHQMGQSNRTPKNAERGMYRNDVSPFRGRFGNTVKNNGPTNDRSRKTPDRSQQSRSPMRRQQKPRQDFQSLNQRVSPIGRR